MWNPFLEIKNFERNSPGKQGPHSYNHEKLSLETNFSPQCPDENSVNQTPWFHPCATLSREPSYAVPDVSLTESCELINECCSKVAKCVVITFSSRKVNTSANFLLSPFLSLISLHPEANCCLWLICILEFVYVLENIYIYSCFVYVV